MISPAAGNVAAHTHCADCTAHLTGPVNAMCD